MPEGPEIRRAADRLAGALVGRRAERVRFGLDRLEPFERELSGRRVEAVRARGKALCTYFEGQLVLYTHNQLYGRWYVCRPDTPPRTRRSLRVSIETSERWAQLYSASEIEVLTSSELAQHPFLAKLGPDLLDETTRPGVIRKRLADARFSGRSLGALLLDQSFLAGVGNYLRTEILFFSGLQPTTRPKDLDQDQIARLAQAARELARRSYRTGGTTEEPRRVAVAKAAGEPRRSWRHAAFGRAGRPCRRCDALIERTEVASRRLYVCPGCQGA